LGAGPGDDGAVGANAEHVAASQFVQGGAQPRIGAVDLVGRHPPCRYAGAEGTSDHVGGQRGFRGEADVVGHPGSRSTWLALRAQPYMALHKQCNGGVPFENFRRQEG